MSRPDSIYTFHCSICGGSWEFIPEDALEISRTPNSRITVFKFADGSIHYISKQRRKENQ
jgi:hypothetical protein